MSDPADWLLRDDVEWWQLVRFGPPGLDVYARVDFADDQDNEQDDEQDRQRLVLERLATHTSTPDDAWAAVWEGWTGHEGPSRARRVLIPERTMLLFQAPVAALRDLPATAWSTTPGGVAPHLAWPADRAWCFACEVDEELAFTVGCSAATADDLEHLLPGAVRRVPYGADEPLYR